jgi:hypothetical protein
MSSFVLVLPKTIDYNVSSSIFSKVHKIGWTPNIEDDKFWNNKSLARDMQNKELPNVNERSIQIKNNPFNTHMIHDHYLIIKLQQNPKIIDLNP